MSLFRLVVVAWIFSASICVQAQQPPQTSGTLAVIPAYGEVHQPNDEALLEFMVEEQDKDKAIAASRVNQRMKEGSGIIRREDPGATLTTRGYYTYPVYNEEQIRANGKPRQLIGWRVSQRIEVTTSELAGLPRLVAQSQRLLALSGLQFRLSETSRRKLEEQRIAAAYRELAERIAAVAKAMGRNFADATIETIDFEASGAYAGQEAAIAPKAIRGSATPPTTAIEEPSFEPGETIATIRVVGKVRFR